MAARAAAVLVGVVIENASPFETEQTEKHIWAALCLTSIK
jgi:hypothetical protein